MIGGLSRLPCTSDLVFFTWRMGFVQENWSCVLMLMLAVAAVDVFIPEGWPAAVEVRRGWLDISPPSKVYIGAKASQVVVSDLKGQEGYKCPCTACPATGLAA